MELEITHDPSDEEIRGLYDGLVEFNTPWFPGEYERQVGLFARGADGELVGGLYALSHFDAINVKYLWVAPVSRKKGLGSALLGRIESEARKLGKTCLYLDTYSFQAPAFYESHGYIEVGRHRDCPRIGVDKIFYEKRLGRS